VADHGAALDLLAAGDCWGDRFVCRAQAANVFERDQRTVHDHACEHHESVACGEDGLAGETAEVDAAVAGTVGRSGCDERPDYGVRCQRPAEASSR
jgi:hypothetical protein